MAKGPYDMPVNPRGKTISPGGDQSIAVRVARQEAQIVNLHRRLNQSEVDVLELQAKLKETIRAVERLAEGKSIGALGLPTEESWQKSTS